MNIVSAVILCTIVGAIGAVVLVLAAKFMAVEEDPRIEEVSACFTTGLGGFGSSFSGKRMMCLGHFWAHMPQPLHLS